MTSIYWPGTRIVRSTNTGFTLGFTGEPIDWKPLQRSANARRRSTANVDNARKTGKDLSTMHGISKKADTRIAAQARKARSQ
jgi:hypothetical protein